MEPARPLDTLNKARDKRIIVELKNNKQYIGKLKSFDIHINIVIEDVEERINGEIARKLGTVFIRGDTITVISAEWILEWFEWKAHLQWARSPARRIWFTAGAAAKKQWTSIKANAPHAALEKAKD